MTEKVNIFGSNHDVLGSSDSNLILRTKGKIKLLFGNKYIDLIKDGKVASSESSVVKKADKVGSSDGLYVVGDDVFLVVDGLEILLTSDSGTTYVSFMVALDTSSGEKELALTNIGFLYSSLEDVPETCIQNGIVYIQNQQALYTIINGLLSKYSLDIPSPYTKQFVLLKNDTSNGVILIKGEGKLNSLAFNNLYIYTLYGDTYVDADGSIYIRISDKQYVMISKDKTQIGNTLVVDSLLSNNATSNNGFRLYVKDTLSTLEIDNLIVRNNLLAVGSYFPEYWFTHTNIVVSSEEIDSLDDNGNIEMVTFLLDLKYLNLLLVGAQCYVYLPIEAELWDDDLDPSELTFPYDEQLLVALTVTDVDDTTIIVEVNDDFLPEDQYEWIMLNDIVDLFIGQLLFTLTTDGTEHNILRLSQSGTDYILQDGALAEADINNVMARLGNVGELDKSWSDNGSQVAATNQGLYAHDALFDEAKYTSTYDLADDDNSSRFASTEWVNKRINELLRL